MPLPREIGDGTADYYKEPQSVSGSISDRELKVLYASAYVSRQEAEHIECHSRRANGSHVC